MSESFLQLAIFFIQIVVLFFISRVMIQELYFFLLRLLKSKNTVFGLLAFIFFPGTVIHEISHFFMATVLFLPVHEIKIIPSWEGNHLTLGRVVYEKRDVFRGILVGIAPFFGAMFFLWCLKIYHLFPVHSYFQNFVFGYIVFTVSSQMFSSKQDLIDLWCIIPLLLLLGGIYYVSGVQIDFLFQQQTFTAILSFFHLINYSILLSIVINIILILIFRIFDRLKREI